MSSIYKIGITISILALILISMPIMIKNSTLADVSSSLFFAGYLLSMLFASIMVGIIVSPHSNHKAKRLEYEKKLKELKDVENHNRIDISFTSEAKSLYQDLLHINEKIKQLKKEMR